MLCYRSWLETRWRFTIGLLVQVCGGAAIVLTWRQVEALLPLASSLGATSELGRRIQEAVELQRTYHGYVWSQAFARSLSNLATIFAVLLGTGGLLSPSSRSARFTLSLPVTRRSLAGAWAVTGLTELLVLDLAGALTVTWLSPSVGERYAPFDAVVHALCLFFASAVFYALACLLSSIFNDFWRPLGLSLAAAFALGAAEALWSGTSAYGLFHLMSGASWFAQARFPWLGITVAIAATGALLWLAARNTERRDF